MKRIEGDHRTLLERQLEGRNLEQALSRIRRIADLLAGDSLLEGLSGETARELDRMVCQSIVAELSIEQADLDPALHLAAWATRADYHWPLAQIHRRDAWGLVTEGMRSVDDGL